MLYIPNIVVKIVLMLYHMRMYETEPVIRKSELDAIHFFTEQPLDDGTKITWTRVDHESGADVTDHLVDYGLGVYKVNAEGLVIELLTDERADLLQRLMGSASIYGNDKSL